MKIDWMPAPEQLFVPDCPPGLEYLLQLDRFIVSQRGDLLNNHNYNNYSCKLLKIFCLGTSGGYRVRNSEGQDIYSVEQACT